jgi:hypothetical protein
MLLDIPYPSNPANGTVYPNSSRMLPAEKGKMNEPEGDLPESFAYAPFAPGPRPQQRCERARLI